MGRSEWAIQLVVPEDILQLICVINEHNNMPAETGEELTLKSVLLFKRRAFAILVNSGGRDLTNRFLSKKYGTDLVLWPHEKPEGYYNCQDYIWQRTTEQINSAEILNALKNAVFSQMPLPSVAIAPPTRPLSAYNAYLHDTIPMLKAELGVDHRTAFSMATHQWAAIQSA